MNEGVSGGMATPDGSSVATAAPPAAPGSRHGATKRRRSRRYSNPLTVLMFLAPAGILLIALRVWPAIESIRLSFTDWDGISDAHYVGWANYKKLIHDHRFWESLQNNAKFAIAVPLFVLVPLIIAAMLQSRIPGWSVFRAVLFFPTLLSPAVISLAFTQLLAEGGGVNTLLRAVGLDRFTRLWLQDPHWAMIWVIVILLWGGMGIGVVIFLAAMGAVDPSLIDAARIDGANWWRVQRHVVFWQILPIIELATVLSLIGVFTGLFPLILLVTKGGPDFATTTADMYSYQQATEYYHYGYASAVAVALLIVASLIMGIAFTIFRRGRSES